MNHNKKQRYNQFEFHKAYDLIKTNPQEACNRFQNYILNYPRDYSAYPHYIMALIRVKKIEEAESVYDYIEKLLKENPNLIEDQNIANIVSLKLLKCKAKILAYQNRFEELFNLLINNYDTFSQYNGTYINFYCKIKLNLLPRNFKEPDNYLFSQAYNYDEKRFLENVKTYNYSEEGNRPNHFAKDFPFQQLYPVIKNNLLEENALYLGLFEDFYIFRYDNCGKYNNKITDYLVVICFHDTKNIITIKPFENGKDMTHFDLNNQKEDTEEKPKTLSRIDKFYRRYNIK